MHLARPRIVPVEEQTWTEAEREMLAPIKAERGTVPGIYRTLVRHPGLFRARLGFGQYLQRGSSLPAREREIVICRIAWLSAGEYEWSAHTRLGLQNGLSEDDIARLAYGPDAAGWNDFDRALLRAVDELYLDTFIADTTWNALAARFPREQMIDLVMTAGGYHMLAMALNTFGVQLEPGRAGFPPRAGAVPPTGAGGIATRLASPRFPLITEDTWTEEEREILEPFKQERGTIPNVYATMARHPAMYRPWAAFAGRVLRRSSLPPRERELLICRAAWLASGEYEWSAHIRIGMDNGLTEDDIGRLAIGPSAPGWSEADRVLVTAADQLHSDVFIDDPTWNALRARYDEVQRMDAVFTVGAYKMLAMALNSFGTPLQDGMAGFAPWR